MKGKVKDHCIYCGHKYTAKEYAARVKAKADNARASRKKALANGTRWGRKRSFDINQAVALRQLGYTYREIAEELGCNKSSAHRALKERQ